MSSTAKRTKAKSGLAIGALSAALGLGELSQTAIAQEKANMSESAAASVSEALNVRQQAIVPVAAFAAAGDIAGLSTALNQGLDAGMIISDAREVLVQLYAYAGFPRSLNALAELMKMVDARKAKGIQDAPGSEPSHPVPKGDALLAAGTENQTKLAGAVVAGPLFDFAPMANEYLRRHLFGDIFERDNLDWQSRELATVSMLAALPGTEAQLQAHMRMSMNTGVSTAQLRQLTQVLGERVNDETSERARQALERHLASQ
ncbi:carboxymuconolactone decarboxylase family protein [Pseudomonas aeruginosa]|uniref:carboxymuconolactone decarboxylase family protein n=2 Tax=Gammaproteobacteria TaxID=1236 RepID=UPI000B11E265|nr:carboxymuconolactone decarboxylase family protein [Pseudomonas aeruginosa]